MVLPILCYGPRKPAPRDKVLRYLRFQTLMVVMELMTLSQGAKCGGKCRRFGLEGEWTNRMKFKGQETKKKDRMSGKSRDGSPKGL